jgi:anti-sigma factor RsiW
VSCRELLDAVEAIAAGDQPITDAARAHLETCPGCAAALATARRIEEALASRPAVDAPPRFTSAVLHRIRRERWRSEERVDRLFNVAMAVAALLVLVGAGFLLNVGAAIQLASGASQLLGTIGEELLRKAAPEMGTYAAAMALLVSALGMWWWADAQ